MSIEIWLAVAGLGIPTVGGLITSYVLLANRLSKVEAKLNSVEKTTDDLERDNQEAIKLFREEVTHISNRLEKLENMNESMITLAAEVKYHHQAVDKFVDLAFDRLDQHAAEIESLQARVNNMRQSRQQTRRRKTKTHAN